MSIIFTVLHWNGNVLFVENTEHSLIDNINSLVMKSSDHCVQFVWITCWINGLCFIWKF